MPISIHGNQYVTVAERVQMIHEDIKNKMFSITTEVIQHDPAVVVKATVITPTGTYTGISAANPSKAIEKMSPYEVAETSAVGRALGFAGYGSVDSIASADEMVKAGAVDSPKVENNSFDYSKVKSECPKCGAEMKKSANTGNWYCSDFCWKRKPVASVINDDTIF